MSLQTDRVGQSNDCCQEERQRWGENLYWPKRLNDAIVRPHHPMRIIEEVVTKSPEAKSFCNSRCENRILANSAWWKIMDVYSIQHSIWEVLLQTHAVWKKEWKWSISKSHGRICSVTMWNCDGWHWFWSKAMDELRLNTYKVLDRAREVGLKLNAKKYKFCLTEVTYVDHKLTSDGLKPDLA